MKPVLSIEAIEMESIADIALLADSYIQLANFEIVVEGNYNSCRRLLCFKKFFLSHPSITI
jgi:hypothetical protein